MLCMFLHSIDSLATLGFLVRVLVAAQSVHGMCALGMVAIEADLGSR